MGYGRGKDTVGGDVSLRLPNNDLREISRCTRGDILMWIENHNGVDWFNWFVAAIVVWVAWIFRPKSGGRSGRIEERSQLESLNGQEKCMGMDTTKLVVGQEVYMFPEAYGDIARNTGFSMCEGIVVEVTPEGAVVQYGVRKSDGDLLRFDKNGTEIDASRCDRLGWGPSESGFHARLWHSAPEFGALQIDEMPFAERNALFERRRQDYLDQPFLAWWKSATYEERLAVVKKYYGRLLPGVRSECGWASAEDVARTADISSLFFAESMAREQLEVWWSTATYEQRLIVVKRFNDSLSPQLKSKRTLAEDVANADKLDSLAAVLARFMSVADYTKAVSSLL